MDGFAVRLADLRGGGDPVAIPVAGDAPIGQAPRPLAPGSCLRIATGAVVPLGADAVIRREDVREIGARHIVIHAAVVSRLQDGQNIRRAGENASSGHELLREGRVLDAAALGVIAACGPGVVRLRRRIRVAIITTGDELLPVGAEAEPWQIRESNGAALAAMLAPLAWVGELRRVHVRDDLEESVKAVSEALAGFNADALILSGGVSMGHRDFVPQALERCGVRTLFHRLPQRPGRPILAGVTADGRPVLALPGNPVSVMVTARRFALPALARRAGATVRDASASVRLTDDDGRCIDLWWHRIVRLVDDGLAELVESRGSGDLVSAAAADGFVEIPPGAGGTGPWPFRGWTP